MESGLGEENPVPLTAVVGGMTTVALLTLVAQAADCPLLSVHERRSRTHASEAVRPVLLLRTRRTGEKRKKATVREIECSFAPKAVQTGRVQDRFGPSCLPRTPSTGDSAQDGAAVNGGFAVGGPRGDRSCSGGTSGQRRLHLEWLQFINLGPTFRGYLQRRALDGPVAAGVSPTWGRSQR